MASETGRNAANGRNRFNFNRRGFLGSTGLAAMGAIVGSTMPLSGDGVGIPSAHAQTGPVAAPAPEKGPQYLKFPGKNESLVVLGEKPLVAETPESLLDDDTTPIEKFMQNYASGRNTLSTKEREMLFAKFMKILADSKAEQAAAR